MIYIHELAILAILLTALVGGFIVWMLFEIWTVEDDDE